MSDGTITASVELDDSQAQADLNKLEKKIKTLEDRLNEQKYQRMPLAEEAQRLGAELDVANSKLYEMQNSNQYTATQIANQADEVRNLTAQYNKADGALQRQDASITKTERSLEYAKMQAADLEERLVGVGDSGESAGNCISRAMEAADARMQKFERRIIGLARRVFVFTLITKALRGVREQLWNGIKANDEAAAAVARLKGTLQTLAQPILSVVIPAFTALVNVITKVVAAIAAIVSSLFGTTIDASTESAKSLNAEQKALKGVGGAAKKAGKELAGFDEINKLGDSGIGGGGGGASAIQPDFTFKDLIEGQLTEIELMVSGALLALGAILTFSGINIPLGIALMAAGAVGLATTIATNWDEVKELLQGSLGAVVALVSGALLVIGAILAFSGANLPLGIALMAAGAAGLATTLAANWDAIKEALQSPIGAVVALLSTALLVVGAILAFSGANIPLGIGLIAAGAVGLAADIVANWDTIRDLLESPFGAVVALVSGASLVLGAVLAFSGASIPLGIALMAAGAIGLVAVAAVNWNTVKEILQSPIGAVVKAVSLALLALGAILTFSGANIPLGIALLSAGAVGLASIVAVNWETIKAQLQSGMGEVTAVVSGFLLVLGAVLAFSGVNLPLGIALIAAGSAGLVTVSALNWNAIKEKLSETWTGIKEWWNSNVAQYFTAEYWNGIGEHILEGLFGGVATAKEKIKTWAGELVENAKDTLGVHSPSTEFEEIGEYTIAGLLNGMKNITEVSRLIEKEIEEVFKLFKVALTKADENTRTTTSRMATMFRNMAAVAISEIQRIIAALNSIPRNITTVHTIITQSGSSSSSGSTVRAGNVPHLAQGAVIPPNREFMAVLGDQKSGTNIEAPLETIVQAMQMALGNTGGGKKEIVLMLDRRELGRATVDVLNLESQRVGLKLGGVYG